MKRSKFSEAQILKALQEMEVRPAPEVARDLLQALTEGDRHASICTATAAAFRFRAWVETQGTFGRETAGPVRRQRPEDPTGRGLNIGRALRIISKNAARADWPDEEISVGAASEDPSRSSLLVLVSLFVVPLTAGTILTAAKDAPGLVGFALFTLAVVGVVVLLVRLIGQARGVSER